ncbi:DNA polymerase beta domain protein region [Candidatus Moduliflexus flocculans]|uniref:DNA polymerase beta domain protein region n=1 Tax=Candidatus Moduliflexus flocculans TaxID=1499966 RepID=A0A081BLX8_9BACT|nr:DNA polymerase beta domain protein region [Candidatus Moduliflexus flocculans]
MSTQFIIPSSDARRLENATRIAHEFAQPYLCDQVVGIVFLGAIARGYFDRSADIDIAMFKKQGTEIAITKQFYEVEGVEVQIWLSDYEQELTRPWDMAKRWTYAQTTLFYDPENKIAQLLKEKVPLRPEEKRWLMMSGLTHSEWYVNRLTHTWVERGNLISAHQMIAQGVIYFFDMLFGLNNELVADMKWRYYCVEQLEKLPHNFRERIQAAMLFHSATVEELERRRNVFMEMWREMQPLIEEEVQMSFEEMLQIV